jgi:hypothetical protein
MEVWKDIETLIQVREYLRFELHRGIKEFVGAGNFKTENAINIITNLVQYLNEKEKLGIHLIELDKEKK